MERDKAHPPRENMFQYAGGRVVGNLPVARVRPVEQHIRPRQRLLAQALVRVGQLRCLRFDARLAAARPRQRR